MNGRVRLAIYFTGALLAILVLIHLSLFSYWFVEGGYETGMSWETVSQRMQSIFWDAFYIIFLTTVIIHSYVGIRNILFEYITDSGGRKIVTYALLLIWGVAYIYGLYPIFAPFGGV